MFKIFTRFRRYVSLRVEITLESHTHTHLQPATIYISELKTAQIRHALITDSEYHIIAGEQLNLQQFTGCLPPGSFQKFPT